MLIVIIMTEFECPGAPRKGEKLFFRGAASEKEKKRLMKGKAPLMPRLPKKATGWIAKMRKICYLYCSTIFH